MNSAARAARPCRSPQTPTHAQSSVATVMKKRWKLLRDTSWCPSLVDGRRPQMTVDRHQHERSEEEHGEDEDVIDHLLLRDQVHEIAGDEGALDDRDGQRERDRR